MFNVVRLTRPLCGRWLARPFSSASNSSTCADDWEKSCVPRTFSGIQPTGTVHLGNYFGAVERWVRTQDENSIYCIVDMHSITMPHEPAVLRENTLRMTASLLAFGIDPSKCVLFQQSRVPHHAELSWVLGCLTTLPRLGHLPQFKEKSAKLKEVPLGIYVYPVLQSADILLYKATSVPVGEDQLQHIQLAQHLAKLFNNKYGNVFPKPSAIIGASSRLKSLRNPSKKMSKSDPDPRSRIEISDSADQVVDKCKKAMTDFTSAVTYDPELRPGVANLIELHSLCSGLTPQVICEQNARLETARYKMVVAESVNEFLQPVRRTFLDLMNEPTYLMDVLDTGAGKAGAIADQTWRQVRQAVGFSLH